MVKAANLRRLEHLERRIKESSPDLEKEAESCRKILKLLGSAEGTIEDQVEAHIEQLRKGGATVREQSQLFIDERKRLRTNGIG
jgi:hypothetical protein